MNTAESDPPLSRRRFLAGAAGSIALLTDTAYGEEKIQTPDGFTPLLTAKGVHVLRHTTKKHCVQVIHLAQGARLHSLIVPPVKEEKRPQLARRSIEQWWQDFSASRKNAVSVSNGQFFNPQDPKTAPLAFTVKTDGKVVEGYGDAQEFPGKKLMLTLQENAHSIVPYDDNPKTITEHKAPTIIVGLQEDAPKAPERAVGRTFLGSDGERLWLLVSRECTQQDAVGLLRTLGAKDMMRLMLDGGGSSNLMVRDSRDPLIKTVRTFPHALGVTSA